MKYVYVEMAFITSADSAEQAALDAWESVRAPSATPPVVTVTDANGGQTNVDVDSIMDRGSAGDE
ncbi:MAG: hypothetical protein ACYDAG_07565 [Chloroflexota bacterium]